MNTREDEALAAIRAAVSGWSVRFNIVRTFTHGDAVQVEGKDSIGGRWKKVGPLIFPPDDGSLADTLTMLAAMRAADSATAARAIADQAAAETAARIEASR